MKCWLTIQESNQHELVLITPFYKMFSMNAVKKLVYEQCYFHGNNTKKFYT